MENEQRKIYWCETDKNIWIADNERDVVEFLDNCVYSFKDYVNDNYAAYDAMERGKYDIEQEYTDWLYDMVRYDNCGENGEIVVPVMDFMYVRVVNGRPSLIDIYDIMADQEHVKGGFSYAAFMEEVKFNPLMQEIGGLELFYEEELKRRVAAKELSGEYYAAKEYCENAMENGFALLF